MGSTGGFKSHWILPKFSFQSMPKSPLTGETLLIISFKMQDNVSETTKKKWKSDVLKATLFGGKVNHLVTPWRAASQHSKFYCSVWSLSKQRVYGWIFLNAANQCSRLLFQKTLIQRFFLQNMGPLILIILRHFVQKLQTLIFETSLAWKTQL